MLLAGRKGPLPAAEGEVIFEGERERVLVFDLPSDAVRAGVTAVGKSLVNLFAGVTTGELSSENVDGVLSRLRAIAAFGQVGQVVVSLASLELARTALSNEFTFGGLGSVDIGGGRVERLFLVDHPHLRKRHIGTSLPAGDRRATVFIGRGRELDDVRRQMDLGRLVSVVGMTGVGKSALIQRLVEDVGEEFADGSIRIDLGPLTQAALVGPTILRVLETQKLMGEEFLDALIAYLKPRKFLLAIDNAEHQLAEVKPIVTAIIQSCPEVAILVGSQRPLRVPGEIRYRLEGMDCPTYAESFAAIQEYDSVSLFVDRAQMIEPKFRLKPDDAAVVAAICQRLDGIPLAIELAAAKTVALSPRQILGRLDDRFLLLRETNPTRPDRHQTLQTTVEWSCSNLRQASQILLRRLTVFGGAFTVDEAADVCSDDALPSTEVLGAFEDLVESSMLGASDLRGPDKRFRLPETMRLYARQRLREAGEEASFKARHEDWCVRTCAALEPELRGRDLLQWLDRMDAYYEDIRGVIEQKLGARGDGVLAVKMILQIYLYYFHRHYMAEGMRIVDLAIKSKGARKSPEMARLLNLGSFIADKLGHRPKSRQYVLRSIALARKEKNALGIATARSSLGIYYDDGGEHVKAYRHFSKAVEGLRRLKKEEFLLRALTNILGCSVRLGRYEEARASFGEIETLLRSCPDPAIEAHFHASAAEIAVLSNRPSEALWHISKCLLKVEELQNLSSFATICRNTTYALNMLGHYESAARFVGAARSYIARSDNQVPVFDETNLSAVTARLQQELGEEVFEREYFIGANASAQDLLDEIESFQNNALDP